MRSLTNKRVLLGVTGGIAAYKSAEIVRRLQEQGAEVRVVMTKGGQEFITPLTLQALSGNPVHTDLLDPQAEAAMGHIELSRWADIIVVAPATASMMSKLARGDGSDLLSTLCLASTAKIALAPAMNQGMWRNAATQTNLEVLKGFGVYIFGPASGEQACGDVGPGRMLEPDAIVRQVGTLFQSGSLTGRKLVISAGPTQEAIDPVRYISNHSSGKMGYAIAEAAAVAGAETILVSGPVNLVCPERVKRVSVTSALEMHKAVLEEVADADIFIGAAAVADYRAADIAEQKLKKNSSDTMSISLVKNPDIIASVASEHPNVFTVGFAAETENLVEYAKKKRAAKNIHMIIANDVSNQEIGFNSDQNAVTIIEKDNSETLSIRSKAQLASDLVNIISTKASTKVSSDKD